MNRAKVSLIQKLREYFESLPFSVEGKNLCVALSGGADSVSLLFGLLEIKDDLNFTVCACHFNHMIRGAEADRDEDFCKELCRSRGIKIYCGRDDVPLHAKTFNLCIEEAARVCRYSFFERICAKDNVDYCLTAHNMNDDAETLLLNLIRGSGSYGASSISPYMYNILRPLLKVSREEIIDFLQKIDQTFVTDSTNLSNDYARNYVRNVILRDMKELNPRVVEALAKYCDLCRNDRSYFEDAVAEHRDFDLRVVQKPIRDRILIKGYKEFSGCSLNSDMIIKIENALFSKNRVCVPLFDDTEAIINDGKVEFGYKTESISLDFDPVELTFGLNRVFGDRVDILLSEVKDEMIVDKLNNTSHIDFDKIKGHLFVRNRRVGDKLLINGMHKSLKKLFIDKKVPKEYRDIIPIIFDEAGIIYVPFIGVSDRVKSNNNSKKAFITTVFNTIEIERWNHAYEK